MMRAPSVIPYPHRHRPRHGRRITTAAIAAAALALVGTGTAAAQGVSDNSSLSTPTVNTGSTATAPAGPSGGRTPTGHVGLMSSPTASPDAFSLPTGVSDDGSIVYIKDGNIFLTSPDLATTIQVTHDGGQPTGDGTGDAGYVAVSQSDDGLIVAIRNQTQPQGDLQGWIWEMDRAGHVIRKFSPPQFELSTIGNCPTAPWSSYPQGFRNVQVSPDGKHVAYLDSADFITGLDCAAAYGFRTIVVDADGSNANQIGLDQNIANMEFGQWTSASRLLVDTSDTGLTLSSYAMYYDDLPSTTPTFWTESPDLIDSVYEEPAFSHGMLATDGYSEASSQQVMRLWTTSAPGGDITARCEAGVVPDGATASTPNFSPDGSGVVWFESDGTADETGEGIYLANTAPAATGNCGSVTVAFAIQGGSSPDWGPALPTQPYFTDISASTQFYADILWLGEQGITTGFPDATFRPGVGVTRGQMAAYLYRYAHDGADAGQCSGAAPYPDVKAGSAFCGDVAWLKQTGITGGFPDGSYRPGLVVTRGQMAAYLYRFVHDGSDAGACAGGSPYSDVTAGSSFCGDIAWLKTVGVTTGYPDGTYRPGSPVTRGQMAAYLHRMATS
jgi:hypothetical protein